jgi:hypothetical protein
MPDLLQAALQARLVADKICVVDYSNVKYIENPYGSNASVTQQSILGTYSPATYTSTADTLTVTEEFVWSEQVYDFEEIAQIADIKGSRGKEAMAKISTAVDKYALNSLLDAGTGAVTTPGGGFTTPTNLPKILGDVAGKFEGYATDFSQGQYLVIEQSDVTGLYQYGLSAGWSFADAALRNGLATQMGGFDVYVVPTGTFVSATLGTVTFTNSGHRLAGVGKVSTLLIPGGKMKWMEKEVSGKTGYECALVAYAGFKAWYQKLALTVDITIA